MKLHVVVRGVEHPIIVDLPDSEQVPAVVLRLIDGKELKEWSTVFWRPKSHNDKLIYFNSVLSGGRTIKEELDDRGWAD